MALVLEQYFLTGRFHATRWNQNPFEDAHGEWPPSPYRLLRTLASRWFEHIRETGVIDRGIRDRLLCSIAAALPDYRLPTNATHTGTWPGRGLKQYQPMELAKTDKKKGEPWVKRHQTSLVVDRFAMIPPSEPVVWIWSSLTLAEDERTLLDQLLRRITYFGRAESLSLLRRSEGLAPIPNCMLKDDPGDGSPVLVADPAAPLNLEVLLANNEDAALKNRRIPPNTLWMYAQRPTPKRIVARPQSRPAPKLQLIQFAVGGRVFPPLASWIRITERFRGLTLRTLARQLRPGDGRACFVDLSHEEKTEFSLMAGKAADGTPLKSHSHTRFFLLPDSGGKPTRLVCYRSQPFTEREYHALQNASELPIPWEFGNSDWILRLVPLPPETPLPYQVNARAHVWKTLTPYVPSRHVFGRNGKPKNGHSVALQIAEELAAMGFPTADIAVAEKNSAWVKVHLPKKSAQTNTMKRAFHATLRFSEMQTGPIALGNSAHFGLGLFIPEENLHAAQ